MGWAIAVFVVATAFWAIVELAAVAGFFGVLMGERLERCKECGWFGLTSHGVMHPDGCPSHLLHRHPVVWWRHRHAEVSHHVHLPRLRLPYLSH